MTDFCLNVESYVNDTTFSSYAPPDPEHTSKSQR